MEEEEGERGHYWSEHMKTRMAECYTSVLLEIKEDRKLHWPKKAEWVPPISGWRVFSKESVILHSTLNSVYAPVQKEDILSHVRDSRMRLAFIMVVTAPKKSDLDEWIIPVRPALICQENCAPVADLRILVFSGECQVELTWCYTVMIKCSLRFFERCICDLRSRIIHLLHTDGRWNCSRAQTINEGSR